MVIRYPNGKSLSTTTTTPLDGYQHRGLDFETDINTMNQRYRDTNRAIIYKKPTPIKVGKIQHGSKAGPLITEAYFEMPSTTDYNGIYRGRYIDFEAKETRNKTAFPFANLHAHQIEHLQRLHHTYPLQDSKLYYLQPHRLLQAKYMSSLACR